jgi:hypothetical protein
MADDLLLVLRERYPEFFSDAVLREIACLPGWMNLIDELCYTLKIHLNAHPDVPQVQVLQAKEKYGGLRFYYSGGDSACREVVAATEERSLSTCEVCGQPGTLVGERWFSVRCVNHINWSAMTDEFQ